MTTREAERRFEQALEPHRGELLGYCYRMLGSPFDAEDAVQETLARAWRGLDRFEGRAALRTWLYRIAGNVCFDMLDAGRRRARPMDLSDAGTVDGPLAPPLPETTWIEPLPDGRVTAGADPGEVAQARESVRLAFVAALQHLPPLQRAVLILREVLGFRAAEVAEQLDTSVPAVNSALQRARATLDARPGEADGQLADPGDEAQRALLHRYMAAFEAYDIPALTDLLHEDAVQSMPPYPLWLRGRDQVLGWWTGPGSECRGSRLLPAPSANGLPAFGQYRPSGPGGRHEPWALQVLEIAGGRVVGFTAFLDTAALFPLFGLPAHPDG